MPACSCYLLFLILGLLFVAPSPGYASEIQVASETIVRGFSRQTTNGKKLNAVPAYEYLQLDYGNFRSSGLSLHTNGWARGNLGDNFNSDDTAGQLLHAYLQYVPSNRDYLVRAGRQYIFEGVAHNSIDSETDGLRYALP